MEFLNMKGLLTLLSRHAVRPIPISAPSCGQNIRASTMHPASTKESITILYQSIVSFQSCFIQYSSSTFRVTSHQTATYASPNTFKTMALEFGMPINFTFRRLGSLTRLTNRRVGRSCEAQTPMKDRIVNRTIADEEFVVTAILASYEIT